MPFGNYRGTPPNQTITDRDFTGQPQNREPGLLYYQARFYVPSIGRFASADTLVPDPANPQQFNRYSYVLNNPLRYSDPTGHCAELDHGCWMFLEANFCQGLDCGQEGWRRWIIAGGDSIWKIEELVQTRKALLAIKSRLEEDGFNWSTVLGNDWRLKRVNEAHRPSGAPAAFASSGNSGNVLLYDDTFSYGNEYLTNSVITHEIGHAIDLLRAGQPGAIFNIEAGSRTKYYGNFSIFEVGKGYCFNARSCGSGQEAYADAFAAYVLGPDMGKTGIVGSGYGVSRPSEPYYYLETSVLRNISKVIISSLNQFKP